MTIKNQTPSLGLELPHPDNLLQEDVLRLRNALEAVDVALATLAGVVQNCATQTELETAVAAIQETVANIGTTVGFLDRTKVGIVNGLTGPSVTLKPVHLGLGPANGPSLQTVTRDSQGRVATLSTTVGGKVALQTMAYNEEGRLATVVTAYEGLTRTETFNYTSGVLTGMSAKED